MPVTEASREIVPFNSDSAQVRTMFDERAQVAYVCLKDLLKAMGSMSRTNDVRPELRETFGEGCEIVVPLQTPGGVHDIIFMSEYAAMFVISRGRTEVSRHFR